METGKELQKYVGDFSYVASVAFSVDGKRIVSGSWDKKVRVFDVETGKKIIYIFLAK